MNNSKYQWILYVIVIVIFSTIAIQTYWNYKNYQVYKQQLINDVSQSLDNAIEAYFANLAEEQTFAFSLSASGNFMLDSIAIDSIIDDIKLNGAKIYKRDSVFHTARNGISIVKYSHDDTLKFEHPFLTDSLINLKHPNHLKSLSSDSVSFDMFESLASKVIISLTRDSLQLKAIDSLVKKQLNNRKIDVDYGLSYSEFGLTPYSINDNIINKATLKLSSKSPFIHTGSELQIFFTNTTKVILKRMVIGLLISTLLILAVISCLFYLLKIIRHQKQIAEVKNDLISNITHEFKTPISTIGVAIESIKDFNVINDKEKTSSYLDMSKTQLEKLNVMVEKLLETATLDSENLSLNLEEVNMVYLIQNLINKHILTTSKTIEFESNTETVMANVDVFHFENAIDNVIDNAIKYGGENIKVQVNISSKQTDIVISDDGNKLTLANKNKIFEKFYRIPKGNTHDVKGFGIGLYYTKKIIEKHKGSIELDLKENNTTFRIKLSNE